MQSQPVLEPEALHSELFIAADGRIFIHNLTPAFVSFLRETGLLEQIPGSFPGWQLQPEKPCTSPDNPI